MFVCVHVCKVFVCNFFTVSEGFPGLAALWEEERQRRQARDIETHLTPPPSPSKAVHRYYYYNTFRSHIFLGRGSQVNEDCESHMHEQLDTVLQERFTQNR